MTVPEEIVNAVRKSDSLNPSSAEDAIADATERVQALKSYKRMVGDLVGRAIREIVYDMRHDANVKIKNECGEYFNETKVDIGNSDAVNRVEMSFYLYRIAGTSLGDLLGEQLIPLAQIEDNRASGHIFNARLLRLAAERVSPKSSVKSQITEDQLREIFNLASEALKLQEAV